MLSKASPKRAAFALQACLGSSIQHGWIQARSSFGSDTNRSRLARNQGFTLQARFYTRSASQWGSLVPGLPSTAPCIGIPRRFMSEHVQTLVSLKQTETNGEPVSTSPERLVDVPAHTSVNQFPGGARAGAKAELEEVLELVNQKKGLDVNVLDADEYQAMRALCNQMVVLTCQSRRHMLVMAENLTEHYKLKGMLLEMEDDSGRTVMSPPSIEGAQSDRWMVVDLGEIIVQIFSREGREYYKLEQHWKDVEEARKLKLTAEEYMNRKGTLEDVAQPPAEYS